MQIFGPGSPPPMQLRLPPQALQGIVLRDGATLQATVRQSGSQGQLTLEISGKLLQAISSLRLTAGITLQLRVEKASDGILLHLDEPEQQRLVYQEALRRELPRQESLRPLFQQLAKWHGTTNTTGQPGPSSGDNRARNDAAMTPQSVPTEIPKPIAAAIARLLAILPTLEQLFRPAGLQQAIAQSGLFLESQLLNQARPAELNADVKTALLRLANTIRQHLTATHSSKPGGTKTQGDQHEGLQGLLRQIEAGIARIQLNQLNALANKGEGEERVNITLELPLHHPKSTEAELIRIRIRRDGNRHGNKSDEGWTVTLHLTPEDYGDIHAVVALGGGKVTTTFWCEEEHTAQLFREQLHLLERRLSDQGIESIQCSSRCGKPADIIRETTNSASGLIDTQA